MRKFDLLRQPPLYGILLTLPGAGLLTLLVLGIEPPLGPLEPLLKAPADQPNVTGTAIALSFILLLPAVGLLLNLPPVLRSIRAGRDITAYPLHAFAAAAALVLILAFAAGIIIDQYPCWTGVPNCD